MKDIIITKKADFDRRFSSITPEPTPAEQEETDEIDLPWWAKY